LFKQVDGFAYWLDRNVGFLGDLQAVITEETCSLGSRLSVIRTNKTVLAIAQIAGTFQ
jgi:hypothetical protein